MIVAIEMGYGHLRAAYTLAESFRTDVIRMDLPPAAGPAEAALWSLILKGYNALSRTTDWPISGQTAQRILEKITEITPLPKNGEAAPANLLTHLADRLTGTILGRHLRALAAGAPKPIIATYPVAALALRHVPGARVFCLATDTDLNRAWAPANPKQSGIDYFAPVERVAHRLRSFGVLEQHIHLTGFPLPARLVAESPNAIARRIHRLDPAFVFRNQASGEIASLVNDCKPDRGPIMMTLAIGGAGAQTRQVGDILRSLRRRIRKGELRMTLVAGMRHDVAETLSTEIESAGLAACPRGAVEILLAAEPREYFRKFEECLSETDVLWTKPGELVFYAALGLPLLLASPVGGQEHANRQWLISNNAALDCGDPAAMDGLLADLLATGALCRIACNAYSRLDRNGSDRIRKLVQPGVGAANQIQHRLPDSLTGNNKV